MDMMLEAGAEVDFLDPHIDSIPRLREYPHLFGRTAVQPDEIGKKGYDAILIATDHDDVDYAALGDLDIPIVDTRNAFASRGLPLTLVTKA